MISIPFTTRRGRPDPFDLDLLHETLELVRSRIPVPELEQALDLLGRLTFHMHWLQEQGREVPADVAEFVAEAFSTVGDALNTAKAHL